MKRMIIATLVVSLGLSALLFVAGCATLGRGLSVDVIVDSLASDRAGQHRRYVLLPGVEGVTWEDLQFQEYAQYVRRALQIRGFQPAERAEDADVAIVLAYGIGDSQTGQTRTHATITAFGNTATLSGTTTHIPTYSRYALITAYDLAAFRATNKPVQLWLTKIMSGGTSGDLRRMFPILMAAAAPHLSSNTGHQVWVRFDESDAAAREAVRAIRDLKPEKDVAVCAERVRKTKGKLVDYPYETFGASVGWDSDKPATWGMIGGTEEPRLLFEKCLAEKGWTLK